jgi:hypothetical protein
MPFILLTIIFWFSNAGELNPGPCICWADILPLSYFLSPKYLFCLWLYWDLNSVLCALPFWFSVWICQGDCLCPWVQVPRLQVGGQSKRKPELNRPSQALWPQLYFIDRKLSIILLGCEEGTGWGALHSAHTMMPIPPQKLANFCFLIRHCLSNTIVIKMYNESPYFSLFSC